MAGEGGGDQVKLEFTPTWIVATICFGVVLISLLIERLFHCVGTLLQRKRQKALYEALQKVKSELMVLGSISLLLVVFQGAIQKVCIHEDIIRHMLPCKYSDEKAQQTFDSLVHAGGRRLLSSSGSSSTCEKGKVPVLSVEAIHEMHLFVFVLATTHVILSGLTLFFGGLKMRKWKRWEDSIQKNVTMIYVSPSKKMIRTISADVPSDIPEGSLIISWLKSFFKQFYGSVTKSDYTTMRHYFVMTHCNGNEKFNFHKYMVRALESDFEKVVGLSWYLWVFVVLFLAINIHGWHVFFWMTFFPLVILLAIGTKLEHIIIQSAHEITEQKSAIEGGLVVNPSDDHFWFHQPRIILYLIHFIIFQNAFEIAIFFWIWIVYGMSSCIMDKVGFCVSRLIISAILQIICSYSTLPLYGFVAQTGSSLKGVIFEEHFQESLDGWRYNASNRKSKRVCNEDSIHNATELETISETSENVVTRKQRDSITEDTIQTSTTEMESVSATSENVAADKNSQMENCIKSTSEIENVSTTGEALVAHNQI